MLSTTFPLRRGLFAILALTLGGCTETRAGAPAPGAGAAKREGILLAVERWEGGAVGLDPIAILTPDGLRNPQEIADSTFNPRWFAPGARYPVRVAGVPVGVAAVIGPEERTCSERLARAEVSLTSPVPADWQGLASDAFGDAPARPLVRPATEAETRIVAALADSIHAADGAPAEHRGSATRESMYAVTVPGLAYPVLAGSSNIAFQKDGFEQVYTAMVVAERRDGVYRPVYDFYMFEQEGAMQRRFLLDAVDLDGDGVPELVTRTLEYEGWYFTVLQRSADGWREIYEGGGGGC